MNTKKRKSTVEEGAAKTAKVDPLPPPGPSSIDATYSIDDSWVSASSTRNYAMKDPILDWLAYHSGVVAAKGKEYMMKVAAARRGESFTDFIMAKGLEFEGKLMFHLRTIFPPDVFVDIGGGLSHGKSQLKARETFEAMNRGVPFIYSGVLHDIENKTYGVPDLLVRSDWLQELVKKAPLSKVEEVIPGPRLKDVHDPSSPPHYHYRVVDIKFSTLKLRANHPTLLNVGSNTAYKTQLYIYNRALANLQGYDPQQAYILGRKWKYTRCSKKYAGDSCLDVLGVIDYADWDRSYVDVAKQAIAWIRDVREQGSTWNVFQPPLSRKELYPNMSMTQDAPWRSVKEMIAREIGEVTMMWQCGLKNREALHSKGIYRWSDERCTPAALDVRGEVNKSIIDKILSIHRSTDIIRPPLLNPANDSGWYARSGIEFFVDFETVNDILTDFSRLPSVEVSDLIFMIGVGYYTYFINENEETIQRWNYRSFVSDRLSLPEEERICTEFSDYIRREAGIAECDDPILFHWSSAEKSHWKNAIQRHGGIDAAVKRKWIFAVRDLTDDTAPGKFSPRWIDMHRTFVDEPIVIRGCLGFGLKDVAKALHSHGKIKTTWDEVSSCSDGVAVIVGAYRADQEAKLYGSTMLSTAQMKDIVRYNEVDVKTIAEIVEYLRENHIA